MFSKALIATDLSAASHTVVCSAAGLKELGATEAVLLYCFVNTFGDETMAAQKIMEKAEPAVMEQKKVLEERGFSVKTKMAMSGSYLEINRQADENECSLIVVGSSGQAMSKFGGVANSVIHNLSKPALVMRVKLQEEGGTLVCKDCKFDPFEHVLYATDFSETSEHAFSYVQKISDCGAKRITLMHVQNKARFESKSDDITKEHYRMDSDRLERLKADLEKRGAKQVDIELPYGLPKEEIVNYTRQHDVSLVVMGSQGRGIVKEFFLGSVSHSVARYAETSVLLIPPLD